MNSLRDARRPARGIGTVPAYVRERRGSGRHGACPGRAAVEIMIAELTLTATAGADSAPAGNGTGDSGGEFAAILAPLAQEDTAPDSLQATPALAPEAPEAAEGAPLETAVIDDAINTDTLEPALDPALLTEQDTEVAAGLPPAAPRQETPVPTVSPSVGLPNDPSVAAMDGKSLPPGGNFSQQATGQPLPAVGIGEPRVAATTEQPQAALQAAAPSAPDAAAASTAAATAQTLRAEAVAEPRAVPASAAAMPAPSANSDTIQLAANTRSQAPAEPLERLTTLANSAAETRPADSGQRQIIETQVPTRTRVDAEMPQAILAAAATEAGVPEERASTERAPLSTVLTDLRTGERAAPERSVTDSLSAERALRLPMQQAAGQAGWGDEIRGNLQWMTRQGIHRAELQLHPAELGSIDVRITTENDQTSVLFVAANRAARELLEAELPRLRELFSQIGVELGQAEVAAEDQRGRGHSTDDAQLDRGHSSAIKETGEDADNPVGAMGSLAVGPDTNQGLIDYYI